jgi:Haem-degrading
VFTRFDNADAWRLGTAMVATKRSLPVTIDIRHHGQQLFHAARPGTTAENDTRIQRKVNVVNRFATAASYLVGRRLAATGTGLAEAPGGFLEGGEEGLGGGVVDHCLRDAQREHQAGADLPAFVAYPHRGQSSGVRVHRGRAQPSAPALHPRLPFPSPIRTPPRPARRDARLTRRSHHPRERLSPFRDRPRWSNGSRSGRDKRWSRHERNSLASTLGRPGADSLIQTLTTQSKTCHPNRRRSILRWAVSELDLERQDRFVRRRVETEPIHRVNGGSLPFDLAATGVAIFSRRTATRSAACSPKR